MPIKVKQDDGTELDAFTQAELDEQSSAKVKEAEEVKQLEIDDLKKQKEEKEAELKKFQDKDYNFEQLRKKAGDKGASEEEVKKQIEDLNKKLDAVASQPINDTKADFVRDVVGEDKERKEKFEYYYKRLGAEAKTKDEVLRAAREALTLASGGEVQFDGSGKMMGTGVSQNYRNEKLRQKGESFNEMAKALGNSEEDIKKYGNKD